MQNNAGTITIETDRLILRKMTTDDAQQMFDNWASNPNVSRYMSWLPYTSVDLVRVWLDRVEKKYINENICEWGVELKDGTLIDSVGASKSAKYVNKTALGYCIGEQWWGKGYAVEAMSAVIKYLHEECGIDQFVAEHATENINSGKVMRKLGMKPAGTTTIICRGDVVTPANIYGLVFD